MEDTTLQDVTAHRDQLKAENDTFNPRLDKLELELKRLQPFEPRVAELVEQLAAVSAERDKFAKQAGDQRVEIKELMGKLAEANRKAKAPAEGV